jgi:hypothetical protein
VTRSRALLCGAIPLVIYYAAAACPVAARAAGTARPANRRVELVVVRPTQGMQPFEAALRDVAASKSLGLASASKDTITPEDVALATTAPPDEAASIIARVFIDFTTPGHATLFLIDPRRGRIHVRRVTMNDGFDAVARESALFVIEESIDAVLEGRDIGVSREEYERSVAPPPPVAPSPPAPPVANGARLLLAAGYDGVALGSGAYQHAARLVGAARLARVHISAAARFAAPLSIAGDGVQAELWTGGVSVSGAAKLVGVGDLSVSVGLGGGVDLTRVAPTVTSPDVRAVAVFWAPSPLLRTFVGIEQLFGKVSVAIALGLEVHLLAERYTVRTDVAARDIFVPRRIRPEAAVLIGVLF